MKVLRILFRVIAIAIAVVIAAVITLLLQGRALATRAMPNPVPALVVAPDTSLLARGQHIIDVECSGCHAPELGQTVALSGGHENFFDIPNGPKLGVIYAPNLTPGGVLKDASDGQISRAVREGVSFEGRPLLVMPSTHYHGMSDRDLASVIAWLRHQPAVDRVVPARKLAPLAYLILGLHQFETSATLPVFQPIPEVPEDSTRTYGAYLTPILGCSDCHGADYRGGHKGQLPPLGPSLTGFVSEHPYATFELALRQGVKPADGSLDPVMMPWPVFSRLTDLETRAVYEFLKAQPK